MTSPFGRNVQNGQPAVDARAFGYPGAVFAVPCVWSGAEMTAVKRSTTTGTTIRLRGMKNHRLRPEEASSGPA